MAFRVSRKKSVNVGRVAVKIVVTVIGLYVSGMLLTQVGNVMVNTSSPFYTGLSLIGWTVSSASTACGALGTVPNCITSTSSSTGILSVIGIIAIASIVTEFVEFRF